MFAWMHMLSCSNPRPQTGWRVTHPDAAIEMRFTRPVLAYEDLRAAIGMLGRERAWRRALVRIDLSCVREIAAPWTPVFALLVWAARTGTRLRLVGLRAPLAAMAGLVLPAGRVRRVASTGG